MQLKRIHFWKKVIATKNLLTSLNTLRENIHQISAHLSIFFEEISNISSRVLLHPNYETIFF